MSRPESILKLGWTFLHAGALAFGGLGATLALIQGELVERQKVASNQDLIEALTYTKLLPGSTGVQVVAYLGWRLRRWPGSAVATACFLLPAAAIMLALAALYGRLAALPNVGPALHGMSAAVVGLVALAAWRLGRSHLTTLFGVALAAAAFTANYWLGLSPVWVVVAAGVIGVGVKAAAAKRVT